MGMGFYNGNRSIPMDWRGVNTIYKDCIRLLFHIPTFIINPYNHHYTNALSDLMISVGIMECFNLLLFLYKY